MENVILIFRAALDFLMNEGHAYSTIDNDHFRVTECM